MGAKTLYLKSKNENMDFVRSRIQGNIVERLYQYDYENGTKIDEYNCIAIKLNLFVEIRNRLSLVFDTISLKQFIVLAVVLRVLDNTSPRIKRFSNTKESTTNGWLSNQNLCRTRFLKMKMICNEMNSFFLFLKCLIVCPIYRLTHDCLVQA